MFSDFNPCYVAVNGYSNKSVVLSHLGHFYFLLIMLIPYASITLDPKMLTHNNKYQNKTEVSGIQDRLMTETLAKS